MQNLRKSFPFLIFFLFGLLLPVQLGKHWWPSFAFINGVRIDYLAPTIYLTDILLAALVLLTVFSRSHSLKIDRKTITLTAILGAGLLLCLFFTSDRGLALYRIWQYLKIILAGYVFFRSSVLGRRWFLYGLVGSSFYTLVLVVLQIMHQGSLQGLWWFLGERLFSIGTPGISTVSIGGEKILRGYGTFSHPNSMAGFFLIVYALCFNSGMWLFAVPSMLLILLSFSKTGVIVFAVSFLFFELQKKNSCLVCRIAKGLFGVWLMLLLFIFHGSDATSYGRVAGWLFALDSIIKNPFRVSLGNYFFHGQPIHNIFLLFAVETGLLGIGGVFFFLIRSGKTIVRALLRHKETVLLLIVLVTGTVDHYWLTLQQNMLLLGVVTGLLINRLHNGKTPR